MEVYAVKHKDSEVINNSRSGGAFTAISDLFLEEGFIYGCILNDEFKVVHIGTSESVIRDKMRGSKYVQSDLNNSFREIKELLNKDKKVMFSGTSCQVAGLRKYLQKDYSNLLCVDIVCHGVPSPKVWKSYMSSFKGVKSVDFRNKNKYGWRDNVETISLEDKQVDSKVWTNIFYSGHALRPSCYECPFKQYEHPGDITIADYWGIENAAPEFDDNKGVSLVLVNSKKGSESFELCKESIVWKETRE